MTDVIAGRLPAAPGYDADIIILCLDRPDETEAAIRSALAQTGLSRHVIVLDQGSGPDNLSRFAQLVDGREDAVLVAAGSNLGVAGGRNRASDLGRGAALIALDNDAIFADRETAARAVALLGREPDCAVIAFRILNADGSADDAEAWGFPKALLARSTERFRCATFVGAGHAIRRQAWTVLGGYDPQLSFTWEEFDFALRAINQGWQLLYAGDIAVHHKRAISLRSEWHKTRWFLYVRNRLYIARKCRTAPSALAVRALAYAVRSVRIGLPHQGINGIRAGFAMPLPTPRIGLGPAARRYLKETDGRWRGGLWQRLTREVLAAVPSPRRGERRK
jgi:GT2 family glycosyltransferase